jgi:hypothetical protein
MIPDVGDQGDDGLLRDLGELVRRVDPVPPDVTLSARSALALRRLDADLAELLYDSALDADALAGVRSATTASRLLTFEASGVTVEVEVAAEGERRRLVGQIVPPGEARLIIRQTSGERETSADALGRFAAEDVAAGPVSIRLEAVVEGRTIVVETGWISV